MPLTSLDEGHRSQQLVIRNALLAELLVLWRQMNPDAPQETFVSWARQALLVIGNRRAQSSVLASRYVRAVRRQAGVPGAAPAVRVPPLDPDEATRALAATALQTLQRAKARGVERARAMQLGYINSSAAATRLTLDGGRDTVLASVQQDDRAVAWMRVTAASPCAFCAVLAAQGARYKSEATASFQPHGACKCTAKPVYDRSETPPDASVSFQRMWEDAARGLKGKEAFNAFRRAHEQAYGL